MKKNGFTLMEVLGVITLLALISTIILIAVDKSLKDSKNTLSNAQIESIKSAANMWKTDNIELIPDTEYYIITLQQLQDSGYIKDDIINPKTNQKIDNITLGIGMKDIQIDTQENILIKNGYTKLDYIKSTGTQYINLDYIAKTNTEIQLDIQLVENDNTNLANQKNHIIGRESITGTNTFTFNIGGEVNQKREIFYWIDKAYSYGGTIKYQNYGSSVTSRSTMTVKSGSATFQGVTIEIATKTADNTEKMILLGCYYSSASPAGIYGYNRYDAKVYSFKIYEGDKLIRDMVPYLKYDTAGLYDLVENKFYTSDGTEDFEYGELN